MTEAMPDACGSGFRPRTRTMKPRRPPRGVASLEGAQGAAARDQLKGSQPSLATPRLHLGFRCGHVSRCLEASTSQQSHQQWRY